MTSHNKACEGPWAKKGLDEDLAKFPNALCEAALRYIKNILYTVSMSVSCTTSMKHTWNQRIPDRQGKHKGEKETKSVTTAFCNMKISAFSKDILSVSEFVS